MARNGTHTPAKPRADIDLENERWNAANEQRGAVAENQYKDYVLPPGRHVSSEAEEDDAFLLKRR